MLLYLFITAYFLVAYDFTSALLSALPMRLLAAATIKMKGHTIVIHKRLEEFTHANRILVDFRKSGGRNSLW